jgi:hypothetical protein
MTKKAPFFLHNRDILYTLKIKLYKGKKTWNPEKRMFRIWKSEKLLKKLYNIFCVIFFVFIILQ